MYRIYYAVNIDAHQGGSLQVLKQARMLCQPQFSAPANAALPLKMPIQSELQPGIDDT
jgi:hypothetical protein